MPTDSPDSAQFPCPPEECRAKRHQTGNEFKTYDTIVGMAKKRPKGQPKWQPGEPLIFHGKMHTLANRMGTSKETASDSVNSLARKHWLIPLKRIGRGPKNYRVVLHDEYAKTHGNCPPFLYDPKGNKVGRKKGAVPEAIARKKLAEIAARNDERYPEGWSRVSFTEIPVSENDA